MILSNNIAENIENAVTQVIKDSKYTKDNLLCFAVTDQPNFLVWSSSLALSNTLGERARNIALENVQEKLFGSSNECSHASLALKFFRQIGKGTQDELCAEAELKILKLKNQRYPDF